MPRNPTLRRFSLADIMILVASIAALLTLVHVVVTARTLEPVQAVITSVAAFLGLGGCGACAARLRGRPRFDGFIWGVVCGPLGVLMITLTPEPRPWPELTEGPAETNASLRARRGQCR
jgi:hypothetical protein